MRVEVKLVVFSHEDTAVLGKYCSYCPALKEFQGRGDTVEGCVDDVTQILKWHLVRRLKTVNLRRLGWGVSENSAIPPIFTDEELLFLTEKHYEVRISDYQILNVTVPLPTAER